MTVRGNSSDDHDAGAPRWTPESWGRHLAESAPGDIPDSAATKVLAFLDEPASTGRETRGGGGDRLHRGRYRGER
jgi:hypothetical protein